MKLASNHLLKVVYKPDREPVAKLVQHVYRWKFPSQFIVTGFEPDNALCKWSLCRECTYMDMYIYMYMSLNLIWST